MKSVIAVILSFFIISFINAAEANASISPDDALTMLVQGNARYSGNTRSYPDLGAARMADTFKNGQKPFATILSCSDSRVPPEHIFDRGIGDLFIVRVAGNVADTDEIGSIEYGVEHLNSPLLVVLGHTKCGAITAVMNGDKVEGSIPELVDNIIPAVERIKKVTKAVNDDTIYQAVKENIWQSIQDIYERSEIVRKLVEEKKLKVVGAIYHIDDGKTEFLGPIANEEVLLKGNLAKTENIKTKAGDSRNIIYVLSINLLFVVLLLLFFFAVINQKNKSNRLPIRIRLIILSIAVPVMLSLAIFTDSFINRESGYLNLLLNIVFPSVIAFIFFMIYINLLLNMFSNYVKYIKSKSVVNDGTL
jgi:carbonic anhydrase